MFQLVKKNYFLLISFFLILYFGFNLVSGERGLFSYIDKREILSDLKNKESSLIKSINNMEHKNSLLSDNLDLDFVETLIRERFLFGKENETIYLIKIIDDIDHKNSLLSDNLDLDFVETLIRERFLFGKEDETIYIIKKNEN